MKVKVFGIIFISFILVMVVIGTGQAIGKALEKHSATLIIKEINYSNEILKKPMTDTNDLLQLLSSTGFSEKYITASQPIIKKYNRYSMVNFVIQILLIIGIALITTKLTISTVKQNV